MERRRGAGFTLIELLVVIAIIGVLIALLLPAVQAARMAARRCQDINNMMQVGIGLQNYESAYEVLPPGSVNASGPIANTPQGYHYSWLVHVLPFVEQRPVYNHLNFRFGVYHAANLTARGVVISVYLCPADGSSETSGGVALTNYAGNQGPVETPIAENNLGLFFLNSAIRLDDIPDGTSTTIAFGEKLRGDRVDFGWGSGTRSTLRNGGWALNAPALPTKANPDPVGGFGSLHPGGTNFGFADGHVAFLRGGATSGLQSPALFGRADGDLVSEPK